MQRLYVSLLFASALMFVVAPDCLAQGFGTVDPNALPKVDYFKARKKIQIVNEGPEVTDVRRGKRATKRYFIQVPQQQVPRSENYIIPVGGNGGATPAGVFVDDGSLPVADFESNMRSLKKHKHMLPSTKMGGVPTQSINKTVSGRMSPASKRRPHHIGPRTGQPKAMNYDRPASVSASDGSIVKTKLKGELRTKPKKYSILKNSR